MSVRVSSNSFKSDASQRRQETFEGSETVSQCDLVFIASSQSDPGMSLNTPQIYANPDLEVISIDTRAA